MPPDRGSSPTEAEFEAARRLIDGGLYNQAVQHAYFAAFHAAREAIEASGRDRPKTHSGTNSAFGRLLIEKGLPRDAGRAINLLEKKRQESTYDLFDRTREEAEDALQLARQVVETARRMFE